MIKYRCGEPAYTDAFAVVAYETIVLGNDHVFDEVCNTLQLEKTWEDTCLWLSCAHAVWACDCMDDALRYGDDPEQVSIPDDAFRAVDMGDEGSLWIFV